MPPRSTGRAGRWLRWGRGLIIGGVSDGAHIARVRVFPLSIPLRKAFAHAAAVRETADPVVVEVELGDGTLGYGEALARPYVSGETVSSMIASIRGPLLERLLAFGSEGFAETLERIDGLPDRDERGGVMTAARAGLELALLDAYSRYFGTPISEAVGWLGVPGYGSPGSVKRVRYSGVLSGDDPGKLARSVRKMRWYGLRDFKLKVGYEDDVSRVRTVASALGGTLNRTTTLRLDANGAWGLEEAIARVNALAPLGIGCVEEPLREPCDNDRLALERAVRVDIMHDESLVTFADAERLVALDVADAFNIRLSKNGGFLASVRLAAFARKHDAKYQLGCMVGETSILSAAGRRFLENVPGVWFAEGSYGRFLLTGDVVDRPVQFGCGGRVKPLEGLGWGIDVRPELLERYVVDRAVELPL